MRILSSLFLLSLFHPITVQSSETELLSFPCDYGFSTPVKPTKLPNSSKRGFDDYKKNLSPLTFIGEGTPKKQRCADDRKKLKASMNDENEDDDWADVDVDVVFTDVLTTKESSIVLGTITPTRNRILKENGVHTPEREKMNDLNIRLFKKKTGGTPQTPRTFAMNTYYPKRIKNPDMVSKKFIAQGAVLSTLDNPNRHTIKNLNDALGGVIQEPPSMAFSEPQTYLTDAQLKQQRIERRAHLSKLNKPINDQETCFDREKRVLGPFCEWMKAQEVAVKHGAPKIDQVAINLALYDFMKHAIKRGEYTYFVKPEDGYLCIAPTNISAGWTNSKGDTNNYATGKGQNPFGLNGDTYEWHHATRCDAATEHASNSTWSKMYKNIQDNILTMTLKKLFKNSCVMILMTKEGHDMPKLHPQESFCSLSFLKEDRYFAPPRKEMNLELHKRKILISS
ncbi:MAG: hypothetical protein K2X98_03575 [Alphaproteobacteria bacterium]|nr:hypothetical protein [Alphaproteobacteria bacterium]